MKVLKKILQFSACIALFFVFIAFILFLATNSIVEDAGDIAFSGTVAIFGGEQVIGGIIGTDMKPSVLALIGWILILVSMLTLIVVCLLPILQIIFKKAKVIKLVAGIVGGGLSLLIGIFLLVAGIFMLFVVPTFFSANEISPDGYLIGAGWVVGAVLTILSAVLMLLPTVGNVLTIFEKKKAE